MDRPDYVMTRNIYERIVAQSVSRYNFNVPSPFHPNYEDMFNLAKAAAQSFQRSWHGPVNDVNDKL